jgi:DNA-binding MarR family transcriptional regulator
MNDDAFGPSFHLDAFLPYMLNQVAEAVSKGFQARYQKDFGITRTQWRILAHLFGEDGLTAKEIGTRIHEDKVSISRAVAALEAAGHLVRHQGRRDRRFEELHLTPPGRVLFQRLSERALDYEGDLSDHLGADATQRLRAVLAELLPLLTQDLSGD